MGCPLARLAHANRSAVVAPNVEAICNIFLGQQLTETDLYIGSNPSSWSSRFSSPNCQVILGSNSPYSTTPPFFDPLKIIQAKLHHNLPSSPLSNSQKRHNPLVVKSFRFLKRPMAFSGLPAPLQASREAVLGHSISPDLKAPNPPPATPAAPGETQAPRMAGLTDLP